MLNLSYFYKDYLKVFLQLELLVLSVKYEVIDRTHKIEQTIKAAFQIPEIPKTPAPIVLFADAIFAKDQFNEMPELRPALESQFPKDKLDKFFNLLANKASADVEKVVRNNLKMSHKIMKLIFI